jgi:hypothetical protein
MTEDDIKVGIHIRHVPTQRKYVVSGIGKMRLPNAQWVGAARYRPFAPGLHERQDIEYYRPLTDFGLFVKVEA